MCFKSNDQDYKSVSFVFQEFLQDDLSHQTANSTDLNQVMEELQQTHVRISDVYAQQSFKGERDSVHFQSILLFMMTSAGQTGGPDPGLRRDQSIGGGLSVRDPTLAADLLPQE